MWAWYCNTGKDPTCLEVLVNPNCEYLEEVAIAQQLARSILILIFVPNEKQLQNFHHSARNFQSTGIIVSI